MRKPDAVIFDIDSTLSSAQHREHLLAPPKKDWSAFHGSMVLDAPIEHTIAKLRLHQAAGQKVVLLSMRPERFRPHTERWLDDNGIKYDALYLRPETDYRPGREMKRKIFRDEIRPKYNVRMAYDDRENIVSMWHEEGVAATHVTDPDLPPLEGRAARDPRSSRVPVRAHGSVSAKGTPYWVKAFWRNPPSFWPKDSTSLSRVTEWVKRAG